MTLIQMQQQVSEAENIIPDIETELPIESSEHNDKEIQEKEVNDDNMHISNDTNNDSNDNTHIQDDDPDDAGSAIDVLDADLDTWKRIEDEYGVFQCESVEFIHYFFIYMGREDDGYYVRDVRSKILELTEGTTQLESSVLMSLVKNNEIHNRRRYKVFKILRYNVTATLSDVESAIKAMSRGENTPVTANATTYITELDGFPTISYQDTMVELEEHNALYIFMVEDVAAKGAYRRRTRGHPKGVRRSVTRRAITHINS